MKQLIKILNTQQHFSDEMESEKKQKKIITWKNLIYCYNL